MKMRNLIIESIGRPIEKDFSKTSVVHARNSVILADIIDADLITGDRDIHLAEGKTYDNIICCYASPYMKYKKLIQIVRDSPNAKLWWFVNDHDLEDNILLRNVIKETNGSRTINMICNNERSSYRGWILRKKIKDENGDILGLLNDFIIEWHTMNLNALIYNYTIAYNWNDKIFESIYYGTMRKWRLADLKEYQHSEMVLSASTRIMKKFKDNGVNRCLTMDKLSWERGHEQLKQFMFSLYVEDEHTHDHYAHMANRFYEALMCNVVVLFDKKCINTIKDSNYDIDERFIVDGVEDFKSKIYDMNDKDAFESALIENEKHKLIATNEHLEVVNQLKKIFS